MAQADIPTLTYFPLHAKGEPIRMLLKHKGVSFNDNVITFEQWGELKQTMPAGQVPTFQESNGKVLNQCAAIMRLLGRKHGYYFDDNQEEAFNVDWALETHQDFWGSMTYKLFLNGETDQEKITTGVNAFEKFNK